MFHLSKDNLIKNLLKIRNKLCAYGGRGICDCKYIGDDNDMRWMSETGPGCPEILNAIDILNGLSEKEYSKISRKK